MSRRLRFFLWCSMMLFVFSFNTLVFSEPKFEPLAPMSMTRLIEETIRRKILPIQVLTDEGTELAIEDLRDLSLDWNNGTSTMSISFKGHRNGFFDLSFEGDANIVAEILLAPDDLKGMICMREITGLNLRHVPKWMDAIIRKSLDAKLRDKKYEFSWDNQG